VVGRSCGDGFGEFGEEGVEVVAEELAGSAEAASLAEGWVEQFPWFDGEGGRQVVTDEAEPVELFGGEGAAAALLLVEPGVEAFGDLVGERGQLVAVAEV
jgi:hypothetical protein